jgi:ComF family protein
MKLLQRALDLLWPRNCEICGRPVDREARYICAECLNRIPFVRPEDGMYEIDDAASAVRFECETREIINGYKFKNSIWLRDDFVDWIEAAARSRFDVAAIDAVIAIPTTLSHRINRGYNQSALLAESLAKRLDRRFLGRAVARTGHPKRQSSLSEEERAENVKGTFVVREPELVRGRTILLVDDIMTTGSTLSECAKTLKDAGAWRVWSVTLARSVRT